MSAELSRVEEYRQAIPGVVAKVAQVVVDNPGQFALIAAGTMVATAAAFNIVRPRTPLQALALAVVLQAGLPKLAVMAMEHGWITFRVRDEDGRLIPLPGDRGAGALRPGDVPAAAFHL